MSKWERPCFLLEVYERSHDEEERKINGNLVKILFYFAVFSQDQDINRPTPFQKCPDVSNAENREYANTSKNANSPTDMVTKAANRFSKVMYKKLRKRNRAWNRNRNLIFSSFSLSTVLAMISPGAKGSTLKEVPDFHLCRNTTQKQNAPKQ